MTKPIIKGIKISGFKILSTISGGGDDGTGGGSGGGNGMTIFGGGVGFFEIITYDFFSVLASRTGGFSEFGKCLTF